MLFWSIILLILAFLSLLQGILGFSIPPPFQFMGNILIFLLVLGVTYSMYTREKEGEKERLKARIRELEAQLKGKE